MVNSVKPILEQKGHVNECWCSDPRDPSPPKKRSVSVLVRMHCMGWLAECRGVEAPCSKQVLHKS